MQGGTSSPLPEPPLGPGCWRRLRRIATRPESRPGVSGRRTHTQGGARAYSAPWIFRGVVGGAGLSAVELYAANHPARFWRPVLAAEPRPWEWQAAVRAAAPVLP